METSITRTAFARSATDVTIRGLIIEKCANPAQMGAIGEQFPGDGWIIEDCEIRLNHGMGIRVANRGHILRNNVHHNGQIGLSWIGDDILVEGKEIAYNNTLHFSFGWEAGRNS